MSGWKIGADRTGVASGCRAQFRCDPLEWDPGYPDVADDSEEGEPVGSDGEGHDAATITNTSKDESIGQLFDDAEMQAWSAKQAVLWVSKAVGAFEILGLRAAPFSDRASLRARFRRLSLLVHPDKNEMPEAAACFQKVSEAYQVLSDDVAQKNLLDSLFQVGEASEGGGVSGSGAAWNRAARRRAARSARGEAVVTPEQAEAYARWSAEQTAKAKEVDDITKQRVYNKSVLESLAPSKKPRRSSSPVPEGVVGPVAVDTTGAKSKKKSSAKVAAAQKSKEANARAQWRPFDLPPEFGSGVAAAPTGGASNQVRPTAPAKEQACAHGWERRESRNKPGLFYYVNLKTGETRLEKQPPTCHPQASDHDTGVSVPAGASFAASVVAANVAKAAKSAAAAEKRAAAAARPVNLVTATAEQR